MVQTKANSWRKEGMTMPFARSRGPSASEALEELIAEPSCGRPAPKWEQLLLETGMSAASMCIDLAGLPHGPQLRSDLESIDAPAGCLQCSGS